MFSLSTINFHRSSHGKRLISYTRAHHDDARRWRRTEAAEGPEAAAAKKASVDLGLFFCRRSPPPPPLPRRVWLSLGGASDRSRCCTRWHSCGSQGLCVIGEACWQQVRIERRNEEGEHWLPCSSRQTIEREFFCVFLSPIRHLSGALFFPAFRSSEASPMRTVLSREAGLDSTSAERHFVCSEDDGAGRKKKRSL